MESLARREEEEAIWFPDEVWVLIVDRLHFMNALGQITVSKKWRELCYNRIRELSFAADTKHKLPLHILQKTPMLTTLKIGFDCFLTKNNPLEDISLHHLTQLTYLKMGTRSEERSNYFNQDFLLSMQKLSTLVLCNITSITDEVVQQLTTLKIISIEKCQQITECSISHLTNLTCLEIFRNKSIKSEPLTQLTKLITLSVREASLSPEFITTLPQLQFLSFYEKKPRPSMSGIGDSHLSCLAQLEKLTLVGDSVSNYSLEKLTNLQFLQLLFNRTITDECLGKLTGLETLILRQKRNISDKGLLQLTQLKTLIIFGKHDSITDASIFALTNLKRLELYRCASITDGAIAKMTNIIQIERKDQ